MTHSPNPEGLGPDALQPAMIGQSTPDGPRVHPARIDNKTLHMSTAQSVTGVTHRGPLPNLTGGQAARASKTVRVGRAISVRNRARQNPRFLRFEAATSVRRNTLFEPQCAVLSDRLRRAGQARARSRR